MRTRLSRPSDTDISRLQIRDPRKLLVARIVWFVIFAASVTTVLAFAPYFYRLVRDMPTDTGSVFIRSLARYRDVWTDGLQQLGLTAEIPAFYFGVLTLLTNAPYLLTSVIIFYYRPDNWISLWGSIAAAFAATLASNTFWVLEALPGGTGIITVYVPLVVTAIGVAGLTLPDGKFIPRWSKWLVVPYCLWEMFRFYHQITRTALFQSLPFIVWWLPLIGAFIFFATSQVQRYHQGSATYRHQLKWYVYGICLLMVTQTLYGFGVSLIERVAIWNNPAFVIFGCALGTMQVGGPALMGVCFLFAVTRYRLYDINVVIHRSLVYGGVTLLMLMLLLVGVFVLQAILNQEQTDIALAVLVIGLTLLFYPARRRVQHFIDRRFYGLRFDLDQLQATQKTQQQTKPGLFTGRQFGDYLVQEVIGRGGIGEVYKGYNGGRLVAIKVLSQIMEFDDEARTRFAREARTLATLDHPNIVKMYDFAESDGTYYMVLEYIDGRELSDFIKTRGALSFAEIRPFLQDFAAALDYAHERGLVHRDIKSSNIMLRPANSRLQAVLMDFGTAKIHDAQTGVTGTGAIGTIDYMAPEQITAAREVDCRADIYALGVVLYEALTGERPFKGNSSQVLFAHLYQPPPDPRQLRPELPSVVAEAIMRAMAKNPTERFESAGAFAAALLA
jgi:predicted Ser/Thr protein kinase